MRGTHLQEAHVASDRSLCEWQAVGLAEQAPETGSYFVASVAQEPIVILRDVRIRWDFRKVIDPAKICRTICAQNRNHLHARYRFQKTLSPGSPRTQADGRQDATQGR